MWDVTCGAVPSGHLSFKKENKSDPHPPPSTTCILCVQQLDEKFGGFFPIQCMKSTVLLGNLLGSALQTGVYHAGDAELRGRLGCCKEHCYLTCTL